jgi:hypothetical protein
MTAGVEKLVRNVRHFQMNEILHAIKGGKGEGFLHIKKFVSSDYGKDNDIAKGRVFYPSLRCLNYFSSLNNCFHLLIKGCTLELD